MIEEISAFVARASYEDLSAEARRQMKVRILDSLACALGAIELEPMRKLRKQIGVFGGRPLASLIGGGKASPDRAALYNGALIRHLGFNDSFLTGRGSYHPSDSLSAVLAASEYGGASGKEFLTALAVAYQVQCRLSEAPTSGTGGFGHITPGTCAVATGVAKALRLGQGQTANAIAAASAAGSALPIHSRGVQPRPEIVLYPDSAFSTAQAARLAMSSVNKTSGSPEASGHWLKAAAPDLEIDWGKEDMEAVRRTVIKKYNAETHSQSALEAILYLRERRPCHPNQIERIELDTFGVAFDLLLGNGQGVRDEVRTREEAYHSLPYLLAVALLDGDVGPSQYKPERILKEDVQNLMRKVIVRPDSDFSRRFPEEMPARVRIYLRDGQILLKEKRDYEGYFTRPWTWERAVEKFMGLTMFQADYALRQQIIEKVLDIEHVEVKELTELLARVGETTRGEARERVFTFREHKRAA